MIPRTAKLAVGRRILDVFREAGAVEVREVAMAQGSKQSRFVAWTFLEADARAQWRATRR